MYHFLCKMFGIWGVCLVGTVILAHSIPAHAMIPVIDGAEISKTVAVYQQLKSQYQTLNNQYQTMVEQYHAVTGLSGWGHFHNDLNTLHQVRQWAPSDWQHATSDLSGGSAIYHQVYQRYLKNHPSLTDQTYQQGKSQPQLASYKHQVATNRASAAAATYVFNEINQREQMIYELGQGIEDAKHNPNIKSAIDLNSRIELEVAYLSLEKIKMASILNQQIASAHSHQIFSDQQSALYNLAGEKPHE